jgi:hypothetical protein
MRMLDMSSDVCQLSSEEENILTSFTRRLGKIAAVAGARGSTSAVDVLNTMLVPAIALDRRGFVTNVTAAAYALFEDDIKIKDNRLFVRNFEARAFLKGALDELTGPVKSLRADSPIVVQRRDKSLVILRIARSKGRRTRLGKGGSLSYANSFTGPKISTPTQSFGSTTKMTAPFGLTTPA